MPPFGLEPEGPLSHYGTLVRPLHHELWRENRMHVYLVLRYRKRRISVAAERGSILDLAQLQPDCCVLHSLPCKLSINLIPAQLRVGAGRHLVDL